MAKGENIEKPKKGGMVLIIGVGSKPPKSKSKVKKAEDDEKPKYNVGRLRTRGNSGNVKADPKSSTGRFLNFRRMMRKDPNFLNETLKRQRIDKDYLERYLQHKHGVTFEEAMEKRLPIPQLMESAAKIAASNRGNDPRKNKKLAKVLKKKGVKPSAWIKHIEENPFWEEEKSFNELVSDLGGFVGGSTRAARNERPKGRKQKKRAREVQREMGEEADEAQRSEQGYTDRDLQTMTNILSASMPLEQAQRMATRYLDSGRHGEAGTRATGPIGQGTVSDNTGGASYHANMTHQQGYPGRHVGGSISAQPSTEFTDPRAVGVKLSSPQEEAEEEEQRKSSDNPMTLAWALLKGNPAMKDARGQNIDQPAAALYDNLGAEIESVDDPRLLDDGAKPSKGLKELEKRPHVLDEYRRMAQGDTHAQMQQDADFTGGRNYGISRQNRHEVEHPNKPSRVKAIKEMLERNGNPNFAMLEMARRLDEQRDFGDASQAPSQPTGTDVKMKPGNIMDQM